MPKHVVRPGDTLKDIAKKHKVNMQNLSIANSHLESLEQLKIGDLIFIPDSTDGAFCQIEPQSLKSQLLTMIGISPRQIQEHYKLYQGYVSRVNEIRVKMRTADRLNANSTFSSIRGLKLSETYALGGYKLHEIYFGNLGGRGGTASGAILQAIVKDFGSYEFWEKDFKATALASRGWVMMGYDCNDRHLHNYGLDSHDSGNVVGFEPLLVVDVYEHAYFIDYGTNRSSYLEALFGNIDWFVVNSRWENIIKKI